VQERLLCRISVKEFKQYMPGNAMAKIPAAKAPKRLIVFVIDSSDFGCIRWKPKGISRIIIQSGFSYTSLIHHAFQGKANVKGSPLSGPCFKKDFSTIYLDIFSP
jgi:hypothetical protein